MNVIAHAETIYRRAVGQIADGGLDVLHRLRGESLQVAFLHGIVIGRSVIRIEGIGYLWVTDDDHLIVIFLAAGKSGQGEVIHFLVVAYSLVEASRAVGFRMSGNLAVGRYGIIDEASQTISLHLIMS